MNRYNVTVAFSGAYRDGKPVPFEMTWRNVEAETAGQAMDMVCELAERDYDELEIVDVWTEE